MHVLLLPCQVWRVRCPWCETPLLTRTHGMRARAVCDVTRARTSSLYASYWIALAAAFLHKLSYLVAERKLAVSCCVLCQHAQQLL